MMFTLLFVIKYFNTSILKQSYSFSIENIIITTDEVLELSSLNDSNIIGLKNILTNANESKYIYEAKLVDLDKNQVIDVIEKIKMNKNVKNAHPNYYLKTKSYGVPNDFYYENNYFYGDSTINQWGIDKINLSNAWNIFDAENPDKIVKIGVLDAGINVDGVYYNGGTEILNAYEHEDLVNVVNLQQSNVFFTGGDRFNDPDGHGTFVAGIIGANRNNQKGIAGVSNKVELYSLKQSDGLFSSFPYTISNSIRAFTYATEIGLDIINCSFGFTI